jgi:hypothetical protein
LALAADGWASAQGMRGGLEFFMERWVRPGMANRESIAQ